MSRERITARISPTTRNGSTLMVSSNEVRAIDPRPQLRIDRNVSLSIRVRKVENPPNTALSATPASTSVTGYIWFAFIGAAFAVGPGVPNRLGWARTPRPRSALAGVALSAVFGGSPSYDR